MGNCTTHIDDLDTSICLSRACFTFLHPIGKGAFGTVWKVQDPATKQFFALKEMNKARILLKKCAAAVMNERKLLAGLRHGFIVNMHMAFQDRESLYLGMDYMTGGDLRFHMGKRRRFGEKQGRFLVAGVVLGLEYIHSLNVMHRDIKPENLVLDAQGYIRITDFGIAKTVQQSTGLDLSGTPGYMAPETICRQSHGFAVDYYALGVILYEMMMERRPYVGKSRREIMEAILSKQVQIDGKEVPAGWSQSAVDLCNSLLQRKQKVRLGYNGSEEVQSHPWFQGFDWASMRNKTLRSPFIPSNCGNFDSQKANQAWADNSQSSKSALYSSSANSQFSGYFYSEKLSESTDLPTSARTRLIDA